MVGPGAWALNQVMGIAVYVGIKRIWVNRVTAGIGWSGDGGPSSDPATGSDGAAFDGVLHPVAGNIYAFVGGSNTSPVVFGGATINFGAAAFAGAIPAGYTAWGATDSLNPLDNSNLTLSGGNLIANAASLIAGVNAPMAIIRSVGFKVQG